MKHKQILSFDAIAKYKIFSKQSHDYEKVLGNRTLKAFVRNLKKQKKLKKINFLDELLKKYPNAQKEMEESEAVFIRENENKSLFEKYKINKHIEDKYYKICETQKTLYENEKKSENGNEIDNVIRRKRKPFIKMDKSIDLGSDPFKYNPNYNSIFKYIPYARLDRPKYINYRNKISKSMKNNNNSINKSTTSNRSLNTQNNSLIANIKNNINSNVLKTVNNSINNDHNRDKSFSEKEKYIFITKKNNDLNETSTKADSYTSKKMSSVIKLPKIEKERINAESEKILNSPKKNNALSFRKMISRKEKDMIYTQSLDVPSFYQYSPNYNYIEKGPMNVSFVNNNGISENDKKKFLMKKLWTSYHVDLGYHLITNSNWK